MKYAVRNLVSAAILAVALVLLLTPAPVAQAATGYVVNNDTGDCGALTAGYTDIQAAVTAAMTPPLVHTILVCPGTYSPFTVTGANGLTIKAADSTLSMPVVSPPAVGGGVLVSVNESKSVVIDRLKLDGTNFNNTLSTSAQGVVWQNSTGTIANSYITALRNYPDASTTPSGTDGIDVLDTDQADAAKTSLIIRNNLITDVDATGINVVGAAKVTTTGNTIQGPLDGTDALQNGVWYTSTGTISTSGSISKNTIITAVNGIYLSEVSKMAVTGNVIGWTDTGLSLFTTCDGNANASSNKISGNSFSVITFGILIMPQANSGSNCDPHADSNMISGNTINMLGISGVAGVRFWVDDTSSSYNPSALKNKVTGNTFFGWTTRIDSSLAPTTILSKNIGVP